MSPLRRRLSKIERRLPPDRLKEAEIRKILSELPEETLRAIADNLLERE